MSYKIQIPKLKSKKRLAQYDIFSPIEPQMPSISSKSLEIVRLALSQISPNMHQSVAPMVFAPLANHINGVEFQYSSNVWFELAGILQHLVAGSGGGKSEFTRLAEAICREFRVHDKAEMQKLVEWQKLVKSKAANKEKPVRPEVSFWFPPCDVTNPAFIQNAMACENAGEHAQYYNLPEVEMADGMCGGHKKVSKLMRNIYDVTRDGQLRATADGVIGDPVLRVNMSISSTPEAARKFYKTDLRIGTFGRVMFSYKPRGERSGKIPRQGEFEEDFQEKLDAIIARLKACKGRFKVPQLNKLADQLALEFTDISNLYDDEVVYETMTRAIQTAWKCGCILFILNGLEYTKAIGDFVVWLAYHDMWSKMMIFGDMLRKSEEDQVDNTKSGPKNMLDSLPESFSEAQLEALRVSEDKPKEGTKRQLRVWRNRGFITYSAETALYTKTPEYLNR